MALTATARASIRRAPKALSISGVEGAIESAIASRPQLMNKDQP